MATLATIRNTAKQIMGLAQGAATAEEILIDQWANEAILDILVRTHVHVNCLDLALTVDEYHYDLPVAILAIKEVIRLSDGEPCIQVTPEEIIDLRRSTIASGEDTTRTRYALLGSNMLVVWPTPVTAYELDIWYVPNPTPLSSAAHDPADAIYGKIPIQYHPGINMYVLWKAGEYANDKPSGNGASFMAQYEAYLHKNILAGQNRMAGTRLPQARVGRRPQKYIAPNDQYPRGW